MRTIRIATALRFVAAVLVATVPAAALAFDVKPAPLDEKEFFKPELSITSSNVPAASLLESLPNRAAWDRFFEAHGKDVQVYFDPRSGTPSSVVLSLPLVPGTGQGNRLRIADVEGVLGRDVEKIDGGVVESLVRAFLVKNREAFAIDTAQLGPARAHAVSDHLWDVSFPQEVDGVPVRWGRVAATLSHGNLVLLGTETWGNVRIDTKPSLDAGQAQAIGFAYAGGKATGDLLWKKPKLEIVPFAPAEFQVGEAFGGPAGSGYGHRLVWAFGFKRKDQDPSWEVLVDARTGEVLAFEDKNLHESKKITGGAYPLTSTEVCTNNDQCGVMQPDQPMPFANTGLAAPNDFTNSAGLFDYPGSGTVTTTLNGKYVRISDDCGAISVSAAGSIDLGGTNGQHDCASGGGSAGNTPASRSAFYETNKLIEFARGWLPANAWLQAQLPVNVNINLTCNAFYSPSNGSVNFYRSGGGCRNTGEIAAVFDHEWGHALDDNDSGGALSSSSEAYADVAAIYRLQASCVGHGFRQAGSGSCGLTADGTGDNSNEHQNGGSHCDLDCSGVRDADWDKHANHTPDTPANFSCSACLTGDSGPCGRQVHCDAAPSRQAAWDFAARDLQAAPFNLSESDAFIVASRIFFQGSGNIGSWHACTCPSTSDGCGATNAYMLWLAADDDNGNLADGTPHMTALHAAFNRHAIACATPTPTNGGCAGGPTAAPVLTIDPASNQLGLSWTPVAGAAKYRVLRSEGYAGCDFGKAVIAEVPGTSYTDAQVGNGRPYSYVVQAVGASSACAGPSSACVTAAPQPCAGAVSLSRSVANCNDLLGVSVVDSDLTGAGSQVVTLTSAAEPGGETVVLTETPANSGAFSGTFATSPVAASAGDGFLSVTHGDTITASYTDVSYCGTPNVVVTRTAAVDCTGPAISNVRAENVTGRSARIKWDTDESASSLVSYGLVAPPAQTAGPDTTLVTAHDLKVEPLEECSTYVYAVSSSDAAQNTASADNGGAYFTFQTGKNVEPVYTYTGPPVAIPDSSTAGASVTINVPDVNTILDVNVKVKITHPWVGDLALIVIGPDATAVNLALNRGSSGDNFTDTVFDDEAAAAISSGTAPFTGSFRPDQALTAFDGRNSAGTWTFKVVDSGPADVGTIEAFELHLSFPPQACGPSLEYQSSSYAETCGTGGAGSANGFVDPGESVTIPVTLKSNGTSATTGITATLASLTPGASVVSGSSSYPDLAAGQSAVGTSAFAIHLDPSFPCGSPVQLQVTASANEGSWVDTFSLGTGTPTSGTGSHPSTDTPQSIPDVSPPVVLSSLVVATTGAVQDVNVTLNLTHTFDGDLDIFLVGPNGTRVELSTDNGSTGDNFTSTVFDDEAATLITAGTAPYTGSFRPETPLSALDGISAAGTWTLEITDDASSDSGTLLNWTLTLTSLSVPVCTVCAAPPTPAEVVSLDWGATTDTLSWAAASGATSYNVYRGEGPDLPKLTDGTPDSCRRMTTASLTTGPTLVEAPPDGSFHWYLVRAENGAGEGSAGMGAGAERVQDTSGVCP